MSGEDCLDLIVSSYWRKTGDMWWKKIKRTICKGPQPDLKRGHVGLHDNK